MKHRVLIELELEDGLDEAEITEIVTNENIAELHVWVDKARVVKIEEIL